MPWTTKEKKLKSAEMAMMIASGPPVDKIGLLSAEELRGELRRIADALQQEYHLEGSSADDLCDLHRLVRCKCVRAWLPPLIVLHEEMLGALDEQKANFQDRRNVFKEGIKFCLQTCERIMFSLTEFLLWQEEGFDAMWTLEDSVTVPPTSKRFLPHRVGEEDPEAATPPSSDGEADTPQAQPSEATETNLVTKSVSFAGLNDQPGSSPKLSLDAAASQQGFGGPRLNRNAVRLKKGRAAGDDKLRDAVAQAQQEAVAGGTSMRFD